MIEIFNYNYNKKTRQRKDQKLQRTKKRRLSLLQDVNPDSQFSGLDDYSQLQIERKSTKNILNYFKTFSFYWSLLINCFHIYTLLSSVFWMSNLGYPSGPYLSIEIVIEIFIIVDIILRIIFSKYARKNKFFFMNFILNEVTVQTLFNVLYIISAIPQATILKIIMNNTKFINENNIQLEDYLSYIFGINIIKLLDLWNFFQKLEFVFIYTQFRKIIYIKFIKTCLMFFLLIHYVACSWTFINKIEKNTQAQSGYYFEDLDQSGDYDIFNRYILSLQWAIEVMSGNSTNDVVPGTKMEILLSVLMMGVGTFILGAIYANFDTLLYYSNFQDYKQRTSQEKTRKFCRYKNLRGMIFKNINNYFNHILQSKNDYKNQLDIIQLPMSLQVELKLHLNQDLIRNVKLLNLGSPDFILETMKYLYPKICMKGDIVIWYGEIANEMYFIKKGKVQIITECHSRVIAIQEEGSYFGEIGLLITGKRTCIVQAIENCIFMCLKKEHFDLIMQQFPDQKNHLIKVSKQRLLTTKASDLPQDKIIEKVEFVDQKKDDNFQMSAYNVFMSNLSMYNDSSKKNKNKAVMISNSPRANNDEDNKQQIADMSIHENSNKHGENTPNNNNVSIQNSDPLNNNNNNNITNNNNNNLNKSIITNKDKSSYFNSLKLKLYQNFLRRSQAFKNNQNTQASSKRLCDYKKLNNLNSIWKGIITFVLVYNLVFVPLSIAFSIDFEGGFLTLEYFNFIIYFLDIIFCAYTSQKEKEKSQQNSYQPASKLNSNDVNSQFVDQNQSQLKASNQNKSALNSIAQSSVEINSKQTKTQENNFNYNKAVDNYFKKTTFIVDILSTIPIDIMLSLLNVNPILCRVTRLLRLTRVYRLFNLYNLLHNRLQWNKAYLFFKFFIIIAYVNHIFACIFYIIAINELGSVTNNLFTNFDSQAIPSRVPLFKEDIWAIYIEFLYYSFNLTSQGCFGTVQAMSLGERIVQSLVVLCSRIITIFFIAQALNSEKMDKTLSNETKSKMESIRVFLHFKKFPHSISNRIYKFYDFQNMKFKGINDEEILSELPNTVQNEIILQLFQNVLQKIQTNQAKDKGVVLSLMKMMKQKIIPKDEHVFKKGEIATDMYFIIEGQATVMIEDEFYLKPPVILAELKEGDYFGEMAILDLKINVRGASVIAKSNLHLASLDIKDFKFVCSIYPEIYQIIQQLADQRKLKNKQKMQKKSNKSIKVNKDNQNHQEEEEENIADDNFKTNPDHLKESTLIKPIQEQRSDYLLLKQNVDTNQTKILHDQLQNETNLFTNENNVTSQQKNLNSQHKLVFNPTKNLLGPQIYNTKVNINQFDFQIESVEDNIFNKNNKNIRTAQEETNYQLEQDILMITNKEQQGQEENHQNEIQQQLNNQTQQLEQVNKAKKDFLLYIRKQSKKNTFIQQPKMKTQPLIENNNEDDFNMANFNKNFGENITLKRKKKQKSQVTTYNEVKQLFQEDNNSLTQKDSQGNPFKQLNNGGAQSTNIIDLIDIDETNFKNNKMYQQKDDHSDQIKKEDWTISSNTNIQSINQYQNNGEEQKSLFENLFLLKGNQKLNNQDENEENFTENVLEKESKKQSMPNILSKISGLNDEDNKLDKQSIFNNSPINKQEEKGIMFAENDEYNFKLDDNKNKALSISQQDQIQPSNNEQKKKDDYKINIFLSAQRSLDRNSDKKSEEDPNLQQFTKNYNSFTLENHENQLENIFKQARTMEPSLNNDKSAIDSALIFQKSSFQNKNKILFNKRKSQSAENLVLGFNQESSQHSSQIQQSFIKENQKNTFFQSQKVQSEYDKQDKVLEEELPDSNESSSLSSIKGDEEQKGFQIRKSDLNFKTSSLILYSSIAAKNLSTFKPNHFLIFKRHSLIMIIVSIYSCIIIPLNIAFEQDFSFRHNVALLIIEVLSTIILITFTIQEYRRNSLKLQKMKKKRMKGKFIDIYDQYTAMKKVYQHKFLINLIIAIPFCLIFDLAQIDQHRNDIFLIILSLNRVVCIYNIYYSIRYYDQNQQIYIEIINKFMIIAFLNHLNACIWVVIGKQESDWNQCWFKRISTTQINQKELPNITISDFSLYLNALSWAFQIMTHTTTGDSSAVNTREEIYSCIVFLCTILFSISFFANISSLIKIISSSLRRDFLMRYKLVVAFIKKMGLKQFKPLVEIYFSYIWETMLGIDENKFLKEFPVDLRADIIEYMYPKLIKYSIFFNIGHKWRNEQIKLSVLRFLTFEIFMPNEVIVVAGEVCKDVFIILEGQVECYNFELFKMLQLNTGDFFGGVLNSNLRRIKQPAYIKASKICKVGKLCFQDFEIICQAFPEWFQKLQEIQNERYLLQMKCLKFFNKPQIFDLKKRALGAKVKNATPKDKYKQKAMNFKNAAEPYEITEELLKEYKNLKIQFQQYEESNSISQSESQGELSSHSSNIQQTETKSPENLQFESHKSHNLTVNQEKGTSSNRGQTKTKINQVVPKINFNSLILNSPTSEGQKQIQTQKQQQFLDFIQQKMDQKIEQQEHTVNSRLQHQNNNIMNNIQSQLNNNLIIVKSKKLQRSQVLNLPIGEQNPQEIFFTDPKQFSFDKYPDDEIFLVLANLKNVWRLLKESNRNIKIFLHPAGDLKQNLDYIYITFVSIYLLYVPITIGFMHCCNINVVILIEVIYIFCQLSHIIMQLKTPPYLNGSIHADQKYINQLYVQQYKHIYDAVTILPLNLIIFIIKNQNLISNSSHYVVQVILDIFRLNSLLNFKYLFYKFNKLHSSLRSFSKAFNIIKQVYFFMSIVNLITCLWSWVNQLGQEYTNDTWMMRFSLQQESLYIQYLYCAFFVLNTVQSTGYPQMVITNDLERGTFIMMVLTGYTLFAAIIGLQLNQQMSLDLKMHDLYITMEKIYNLIESSNMPKGLRQRVDMYFTYLTETNMNDIDEITKIKGMIPTTMYNNILYNQAKQNLNQFKVFKDLNNSYLVRQISPLLKQEIFLEGDYIIRKDEFGNRMFFLISGKVQIVSENEFQTLKVINPGHFFGEISLFTENYKRIASVIANTVVHVYSIKKSDIQPIFQYFPEFKEYIMKQATERLRDTRQKILNEEKRKSIFNNDVAFKMLDKNQSSPPNTRQRSPQFFNVYSGQNRKEKQQFQISDEEEEQANQIQKQEQNQVIIITNQQQQKQKNKSTHDATPKSQKKTKDGSQKIIDKKSTISKKKLTKTLHLQRKFDEDFEANNEEVDLLIQNHDLDLSDIDVDLPNSIDQESKQIYNTVALSNLFNVNKIEILCSRYKDQSNVSKIRRHKLIKNNLTEFTEDEGQNGDDSSEKTLIKDNTQKQDKNDGQKNNLQDFRERISFNELVHQNEMDFKNHPDLQSRRRLQFNRKSERRLSRINLKKQIKLSKQSEMRLQWGMNLEYN
ncbi:cation channel family protein (macronuclear) [Tetrahymena thermophila SB210]|uniref:Cation channel family protein n=1 Tax=Tetrahymena thermophila (strain SB210) TaxID=312017 RepID=Q22X19_TETTS|nr:cation channel family protein [Tetrahymena thermophila SB210]EAR89827.2 cation channel family protein [Tetrahymena thermophila SB210]|eukprot:XP_001010072.2 cation channel family protein [Tetrahymena thermophila SB210]